MLTYILRVGEFYHTWEFDLNGDGFKYSSCCWGYNSVSKVLAFPARSPMLHPQHLIDWAYTAFEIEAGGSEILSDLWLQSSFEVSLGYRTSCHSAPQRAPDVRTLMEIHIRLPDMKKFLTGLINQLELPWLWGVWNGTSSEPSILGHHSPS